MASFPTISSLTYWGIEIYQKNGGELYGTDMERNVSGGKSSAEWAANIWLCGCGGVAAAILSSGKIYVGVCVDACSTLGICAERNAIYNMITNGEQKTEKVPAIMPNGKSGAPCGACRELMVQLMPNSYQEIEALMDFETEEIVILGELTPKWWI